MRLLYGPYQLASPRAEGCARAPWAPPWLRHCMVQKFVLSSLRSMCHLHTASTTAHTLGIKLCKGLRICGYYTSWQASVLPFMELLNYMYLLFANLALWTGQTQEGRWQQRYAPCHELHSLHSAGSNPCLAAMLEHWNSSKTTDAGRGCQVQFTLDLPLKADWHPCRQYGWLPHAWSIDRATQLVRYMLAKIASKSLGISLQKYRRDRLHKIYYHPPLPCVHVVHDSSCSLNGWLVFLISLKMN